MSDPQWETLKKRLRQLESSLYTALLQYQALSTNNQSSSTVNHSITSNTVLEQQIETELQCMRTCCDELYVMLQSVGSSTTTHTSLLYAHNRYTGVLNEFTADYNKQKQRLQQSNVRAQLLSTTTARVHNGNTNTGGMSTLLDESNGLQRSLNIADTLLDAGTHTQQSLQKQHTILQSTRTKLLSLSHTFPTLNKLMSRITVYKHRDNIILAVLIATCIVFTLWYWSNKP